MAALMHVVAMHGCLRIASPEHCSCVLRVRAFCAGETQRKRQLSENDPVRTLKLSTWAKDQFQQAEQLHGPSLGAAINALGGPVADSLRAMWA